MEPAVRFVSLYIAGLYRTRARGNFQICDVSVRVECRVSSRAAVTRTVYTCGHNGRVTCGSHACTRRRDVHDHGDVVLFMLVLRVEQEE